jgi:hypothetical protein
MASSDPKAENLIRNIWLGNESTKCDGSMNGYSNLASILSSNSKKADARTTFFELVSGGFTYKYDVDYTF